MQWLAEPAGDRPAALHGAQSHPDFSHGPAAPRRAARLPRAARPGFNPRTLQLASDDAPRPAPQVPSAWSTAVLERLRSGGYSYTLEPGVYGQHTADEFWFDRKKGFANTSRRPLSS
jgi:hypothetical protein